MKNKSGKTNRVVRIFFMTIAMSVLVCWGATAQTSFGSSSGLQDPIFEEYEFSETTPSENIFNELNNSGLREGEEDEWGNTDGPEFSGEGPVTPVAVPIGEGLWILLLGGVLYGAVLFRRRKTAKNN